MDMKLKVVVVPVLDVDQVKGLYVRNPDGCPVLDSVPVSVDITDAAFS